MYLFISLLRCWSLRRSRSTPMAFGGRPFWRQPGKRRDSNKCRFRSARPSSAPTRFTLRSDNGLPAFVGISLLSLSVSEHSRDWRASDQGSGRDDGAFWDNHNTITNAIVFAVRVGGLTLGCDHDSFPNTNVFVDNGALNLAAASDAEWWKARLWVPGFCLVIVCPHQDRVADRGAASDHAPNPDDRPVDVRIGNDRAIGDNRPLNLRSADLACRQVTLLGVDSINVVKKIERRHRIGQSQVGFEKRPYCSDIFPVPLKNVGKDSVLLQRARDNVLAEVVVIVG